MYPKPLGKVSMALSRFGMLMTRMPYAQPGLRLTRSDRGSSSIASSLPRFLHRRFTDLEMELPAGNIKFGAEKHPECDVGDLQWQWKCYEEVDGRIRKIKERHPKQEKKKHDNRHFYVIYRRTKYGVLMRCDIVKVTVISSPLKKILQQFFPENGDLRTLEAPTLMGADLFLVREPLQNHLAGLQNALDSGSIAQLAGTDASLSSEEGIGKSHHGCTEANLGQKESGLSEEENLGALHLTHLIRFLNTEYKDEIVRARRMEEERRVSWDMLWVFLRKGTRVAYHCDYTQELLCGVVATCGYSGSAFSVQLDVRDFDGKQYKQCQTPCIVEAFEGEHSFAQLSVSPVNMLQNESRLEARFLANGKTFYELAVKSPSRYMQYSGVMFRGMTKLKADGRVMIDLRSFASMNPGYSIGTTTPQELPKRTAYYDTDEEDLYSNYGDNVSRDIHIPSRNVSMDLHSKQNHVEHSNEISDETLKFAPAIVYGFSFALKEWGAFAVSGFSDIFFDVRAFNELAMDSGKKLLIYNLVKQYIDAPADDDQGDSINKVVQVDPISEKGKGCLFVCYGPPGTGKTLTAESIAEKMKQPLWSLSVAELGTSPSVLEAQLVKYLEITAKWQAVLLLDEADMYLEKRAAGDVLRNAMTGVFLRLLEYHQGILFLTTNRIDTFDDAFRSRISLFVYYPPLSLKRKAKVWQTMLMKVGVQGASDEFCGQMAVKEMNGREIRNAIHLAQVWAKSSEEALNISHVKYVTEILTDSLDTLARGHE